MAQSRQHVRKPHGSWMTTAFRPAAAPVLPCHEGCGYAPVAATARVPNLRGSVAYIAHGRLAAGAGCRGGQAPRRNGQLRKCGAFFAPKSGALLASEATCVLLHRAVQRGLFRALAPAVHRGAIWRPLGLPADGLHARLAKWWRPTFTSRVLSRPLEVVRHFGRFPLRGHLLGSGLRWPLPRPR